MVGLFGGSNPSTALNCCTIIRSGCKRDRSACKLDRSGRNSEQQRLPAAERALRCPPAQLRGGGGVTPEAVTNFPELYGANPSVEFAAGALEDRIQRLRNYGGTELPVVRFMNGREERVRSRMRTICSLSVRTVYWLSG